MIVLSEGFWTPRAASTEVTARPLRSGSHPGIRARGLELSGFRAATASSSGPRPRVWCAPDARLKFRAYWFVVRPGAG